MTAMMKTPGPDHPVTIEPAGKHVTVRAGGVVIASSDAALSLREANYPPVLYIPRADVAMDQLKRSGQPTHCPYKGDGVFYDIPAAGERGTHAAWSYEAPYPAAEAIRDHFAFYPNRVDAIDVG